MFRKIMKEYVLPVGVVLAMGGILMFASLNSCTPCAPSDNIIYNLNPEEELKLVFEQISDEIPQGHGIFKTCFENKELIIFMGYQRSGITLNEDFDGKPIKCVPKKVKK